MQPEIEIENQIYPSHESFGDELIYNGNQMIHPINNPQILNQPEPHLEKEYIDVERIINFEEVKVFIDELICPICSHILIDPRICQDCSQGFCKQCLSQWFNQYNSKSCPCCRSISTSSGVQAPKLLFKLLSKLKISCKYNNNGCKEVIWYDNKEKHYDNECEYKLIICQYCFGKILKMDSKRHFQECEFKPFQCILCSQTSSCCDSISQDDNCSFRASKCTQCKLEIKVSNINNHAQNYCSKKQIKKFKNQYQQSKSEIQKTKQELLEQMQKIKKLDRFIKKQKFIGQEKKSTQNNEQINSSEEIQLDLDPFQQYQQQFDLQSVYIQEQFWDDLEKHSSLENDIDQQIDDVSLQFSNIEGTCQTTNFFQEQGSDQ